MIALSGGEADGAWFEDHALEGRPPQTIEVAVGGELGPALLDLPNDLLELDEHVLVYELSSVAFICGRRRSDSGHVAVYVPPSSELDARRRRRPRSSDDVVA